MVSTLVLWFAFVIFTSRTKASHFRGGIITWKPDENIANKVLFNFRLGFRRSFSNSYYCDSSMVAHQSIVGSGGSWTASHDRGYYSSRTVADTGYHCTDFSVNEDWTQGENTFTYTFPNEGPWLVSYSSCCWISLINGGGNWFLSTTVNLTKRQDNGKINSSPISALSPIVRHQQGCSKTISIPAEDSDGDKVRCRWSTGQYRECGGVCHGFKSSTLDEEKCTLKLHSNAAVGWHAVAITLEDFPASTTNFQMATPFSHVSLQFLVHVAPSSGPCNRVPILIGQSPNDGSCEEVSEGDTFYSVIEAKHIDSSRRIAEIITVTPLYMNLTRLLNYTDHVGDTVYYKNVSWSPKLSQKGRHIFCFKAIDEYGMESGERCITILAGSNNTPTPILSSRSPVIPPLSWPLRFGFVDLNITFDQRIKKPRHAKFVEIVLQDHVIYKLDTRSSSDVTIDGNGFTLRFRLPQVVLSMQGNYSITLDRGAVVGLGCTSDGPPTPGISSTTSWTFSVGVCSKGTFIDHSYNCNDVDECSSPLPILSPKKRNPWYLFYGYSSFSSQAMHASLSPYYLLPTPASSAAVRPSLSGPCSYYLNQRYGRFTSPNYPGCYPNNQHCTWLIEAPRGYNYIHLYFESFDLDCHYCQWGYCYWDFVNIFDGSSSYSPKITKACGQLAPWELYSSGRYLLVQFHSNGFYPMPGFSATYRAVSYRYSFSSAVVRQHSSSPVMCYSSRTASSISSTHSISPTKSSRCIPWSSSSAASSASVSGSCPYSTNQQNGQFTSPNYPWNYGNNDYCYLLIEAPHGHYIYVQFTSFNLQSWYDYVDIFDGNSAGSPRIVRASGYHASSIHTSGRYLFAQFRSNWSQTRSGFSATYHVVSNGYSIHQVSSSLCIFPLSSSLITSTQFSSAMYSSTAATSLSPTTAISPTTSSGYITRTSSTTGPVNIQASATTLTPTASRVPFVLHLPAQCKHNCVNTWGSYYCTCRQGYKLQADGKTCLDIDECETQNGGCTHQCINTPGSHYCKCREGITMGFDNKTCHEPGINVKCTDEAMFIFLERKSFQGFDPNKLTLLYPSCRASYNDTHITLRTNLNDCGTTHNESEDTITFYNQVRSVEFSPGNVITRNKNVSIPFYCSYGRKAIIRNPSFKTWKNYVTSSEGGYGNFTFTMHLFKTSNYYTPYNLNDYPITVSLLDRLFVQIAVESFRSNLVVFADTCKATPSSDPYSVPQYIFLQRGCGLDSTLNYSYSISSKQRFSILAFSFIEDHPVVHFHCEVLACHKNTARSRCLQGCSRNRGRRDEEPGSESTQVYEMSSGPIKFQKKSKGKVDKKAEAQTNMAPITAVASAGGVCLLIAIALAIVVVQVKKRFKGALADRNKVYAMEQVNKYVKEENDNDGFDQDDDVNGPGEQNIVSKASA